MTLKTGLLGFFLVVTFLFFGMIFTTSVGAYTLSPSSGNVVVGESYTITVLADPPDPGNDTSTQVELITSNSNIQITDASPSTGGTLTSGVCPASGSFASDRVCFIYGDSNGINTGDTLGTFTFTAVSEGETTIDVNTSDPVYTPSNGTLSGTLGTYTIISSGSVAGGEIEVLPETFLDFREDGLLIVGIYAIILGIILYFVLRPKKEVISEI